MTNEHVANIAITVTAAMLATAAVVFTLSGNAPADPGSADLPVISVGTASAKVPTPGVTAPLASATSNAAPAPDAVPAPRVPFTAAKPSERSATVAAGGSASAVTSAATSSLTGSKAGTKTSHDSDEEKKDHEVVVPKVHETDEHHLESDHSERTSKH